MGSEQWMWASTIEVVERLVVLGSGGRGRSVRPEEPVHVGHGAECRHGGVRLGHERGEFAGVQGPGEEVALADVAAEALQLAHVLAALDALATVSSRSVLASATMVRVTADSSMFAPPSPSTKDLSILRMSMGKRCR
jgi:hypothetical protein